MLPREEDINIPQSCREERLDGVDDDGVFEDFAGRFGAVVGGCDAFLEHAPGEEGGVDSAYADEEVGCVRGVFGFGVGCEGYVVLACYCGAVGEVGEVSVWLSMADGAILGGHWEGISMGLAVVSFPSGRVASRCSMGRGSCACGAFQERNCGGMRRRQLTVGSNVLR